MTAEATQFIMPPLPFDKLAFLLNSPILIIIFLIFFAVYLIVSIVLIYHWSAYGMKSSGILVAETLYIFISAILFCIASMALYYY